MSKVIGVDIGGTHTRWGLIENGLVSSVEKMKTDEIDDFVAFIMGIIESIPLLDAICIGVPGIVKDNKVINIPNIERLNDIDLAGTINKNTGIDVLLFKDVRLLFAFDSDRLKLTSISDVIAIYLGTGIGNVIKINGRIIEGENGFSCELGHIPILDNIKVCGCGKTGCAETVVSGKALVQIYNEANLSGDFSDIFINHVNHPRLIKFIEDLSRIIAIEVNILDILTIVLGGGVINMKGFPRENLKMMIIDCLRTPLLQEKLQIFFVEDSPLNSIYGASFLVERN